MSVLTSPKEEVIDRRNVMFQMVTRMRNGEPTEILNGVKMHFMAEPAGTLLYMSREQDNSIRMTKEYRPNTIARSVNRIAHRSGQIQQYLNLKDLVDEEDTYEVVRKENEYCLRVSEEKIKKTNRGNSREVNRHSMIHIPKKLFNRLVNGKQTPVFVVDEVYRPYTYMKIRCVEEEYAKDILSFHEQHSDIFSRRANVDSCTYRKKADLQIYMNRYFMTATKATAGTKMEFWMNEQNELFLESPDKICDICKKPIRAFTTKTKQMYMCGECNTSSKLVRKIMAEQNCSMAQMLQNVKEAQKTLTALKASM